MGVKHSGVSNSCLSLAPNSSQGTDKLQYARLKRNRENITRCQVEQEAGGVVTALDEQLRVLADQYAEFEAQYDAAFALEVSRTGKY